MYPLNPQLFLASYHWLGRAINEDSLLGGTPLKFEPWNHGTFSVVLPKPCQLALWVLVKSLLSHTDNSWKSKYGLMAQMDQWSGERPLPYLLVEKPPTDGREPSREDLLRHLKACIESILIDAKKTLVLSLETLGFRA